MTTSFEYNIKYNNLSNWRGIEYSTLIDFYKYLLFFLQHQNKDTNDTAIEIKQRNR